MQQSLRPPTTAGDSEERNYPRRRVVNLKRPWPNLKRETLDELHLSRFSPRAKESLPVIADRRRRDLCGECRASIRKERNAEPCPAEILQPETGGTNRDPGEQ